MKLLNNLLDFVKHLLESPLVLIYGGPEKESNEVNDWTLERAQQGTWVDKYDNITGRVRYEIYFSKSKNCYKLSGHSSQTYSSFKDHSLYPEMVKVVSDLNKELRDNEITEDSNLSSIEELSKKNVFISSEPVDINIKDPSKTKHSWKIIYVNKEGLIITKTSKETYNSYEESLRQALKVYNEKLK